MPFCMRASFPLTSGKYTILLAPASFPRVLAQADLYELYRFSKLRFRIATMVDGAGVSNNENVIAAYFSNAIDATPAFADLNENIISSLHAIGQTTKSDWVDVQHDVLKGALIWYKAIAGTMESYDEVQGNICLGSSNVSSTGSVICELEGTVEFTSPADPAATPADRARRNNEKERLRLLKLLSSSPATNSVPVRLPTGQSGKTV